MDRDGVSDVLGVASRVGLAPAEVGGLQQRIDHQGQGGIVAFEPEAILLAGQRIGHQYRLPHAIPLLERQRWRERDLPPIGAKEERTCRVDPQRPRARDPHPDP